MATTSPPASTPSPSTSGSNATCSRSTPTSCKWFAAARPGPSLTWRPGPWPPTDPEILLAHGPIVAREGCMSVPDLTGDVARATRLVVRGTGLDGGSRVLQVDAFEARAVLHEMDHLDGLLFLDRVVSTDHVFSRKVYR